MKTIVFSCFTPYHLVNAMYYGWHCNSAKRILIWNDYADYGIDVRSLKDIYFDEIVIIPYFLKGSHIARQLTKAKHAGRFFKLSSEYKVLSSNDCEIFVLFSDQEPCCHKQMTFINSKRDIKNILVEEGVATYTQAETKYNKLLLLVYKVLGIEAISRIGMNSRFDTVIVRHPKALENNRYQCKRIIKQNFFACDSGFVDSIPFTKDFNIPHNYKQNILILGQPISEIKGIENYEYLSLLKSLVLEYGDKYNIIVKPHPREDPNYYKTITGLTIMEPKWIPVELAISKLDFNFILSIFSSAAFNAYEIKPKIKNIYLYKLFPHLEIDDSLFKKYEILDNTFIPNSFDNLKKAMDIKTELVNIHICNHGEDLDYFQSILKED